MKTTTEKTENRQAFLTIELEPAEVEESLEGAYRRLVQKTQVPGFRKGKAPRVILERYVGKGNLLEDALHHLIPEACEKAIKEKELEAIAQPQIEVTQTAPVIFKAVVPLKPTTELGDYHSISLVPETETITESNVDDVIERMRHQRATWEPVERAADFGDLVVLDIASTVENQPFLNHKNIQYPVTRDQLFPVPGFVEQLVGLKVNEEKEFKLQLPPDYSRQELAGKDVSFKVRIASVKQEILPALNDDFAKQVDAELLTVAALREQAAKKMGWQAEERTKVNFEHRVIDAVVDLSKVEYPPILVESEVNRILNQRFEQSGLSLENYLRLVNKTEAELSDELRPLASKGVARSLVLDKVAEEAKIEVTVSDIDAEIEKMTQEATSNKDIMKEALNTQKLRKSIEKNLLTRKTIQLLTDIARESKETKRTEKEEGK